MTKRILLILAYLFGVLFSIYLRNEGSYWFLQYKPPSILFDFYEFLQFHFFLLVVFQVSLLVLFHEKKGLFSILAKSYSLIFGAFTIVYLIISFDGSNRYLINLQFHAYAHVYDFLLFGTVICYLVYGYKSTRRLHIILLFNMLIIMFSYAMYINLYLGQTV